jgi:serine/threonine protein kinase
MEPASVGAVLTEAGVIAGTSCYMPPEQALGEPIDQRSDLFSVGILLYEMTTGHRPFSGASDAALYDALLRTSPAAPTTLRDGLPVEFDLIISRALEKDREVRYQSVADPGADLKRLQRLPALGSAAAPSPGTAAAHAHGKPPRWRRCCCSRRPWPSHSSPAGRPRAEPRRRGSCSDRRRTPSLLGCRAKGQ